MLAASLRLIPSINKIMSNYNHILFFRSSSNVILKEFSEQNKIISENFSKKLLLNNTFEIKNANFSYNDKTIFKNLNFIINKNDCIGIYGESGSGKTTLIDIIMTLNRLDKGEIFLDKILLNNKDEKKMVSKYILCSTIGFFI